MNFIKGEIVLENKLARFFKTTGMLRFFLPIGILLIVMGILMLSMTPKSYGETTGIITDAVEYIDTDSEGRSDTYYEAVFTYTVDGVQYENSFSGYAEKPEIGKEIPVFYDPDNPESVSNSKNTGVISVIMIALGVAAAAFGVLSTVRRVRKNRELDEKLKSASGTGEMPVVTPIPKERLTEYYVSFDGNSLKPGYIVEDRSRNVIFTAPMTKNSLWGTASSPLPTAVWAAPPPMRSVTLSPRASPTSSSPPIHISSSTA